MRLEQILIYFDTSPAVRLLRAQLAPFIIDFLFQQFKRPGRPPSLPASELLAALYEYREKIHESHPEVLLERAEQYLSAWSSGETRWLHRYLEAGRNEPVYQLTPHTEEVFGFMDRALQRDLGFVGTESRLRLVISTLADLVAGASDDPEVRLSHLRDEQQRIDEEISKILQDGGIAARYEPPAARERFATAVSLLKDLLSDFRAVEERFKDITRQVQRRQLDGKETRGEILQFALDAEDVLKKEDQGVSFYEFVRFILSPVQREKLQIIISELGRIDALSQQADGLAIVRRMVPSLLADAEKVMRTNQRLSATLRRLLDARAVSDRKRLTQLIAEIRTLASGLADDPPVDLSVSIDTGIVLSFPFAKALWSPAKEFARVELVEEEADGDRRLEVFRMLAHLHRLDWKAMRERVHQITARARRVVSLSEIIAEFPPEGGLIELLAYIQIAKDDGHIISFDRTENLVLHAGVRRKVTLPLVLFSPPAEVVSG